MTRGYSMKNYDGVVGGCGHVGLPLLCFADKDLKVSVDINQSVVDGE